MAAHEASAPFAKLQTRSPLSFERHTSGRLVGKRNYEFHEYREKLYG
jgi:hypothetical protein